MVDAAGLSIGVTLMLIGIVLITIELVHPGVFIIVPGTVFLASGIGYLLIPDFLTNTIFGPVIVALAALLSAVLSFYWYQHLAPVHPPLTTMPSTLAGSEGIVIAPVLPDSLRGKVRIRSDVWSARSRVPLPVGTRVRIIGGEGVSVEVVPIEEGPPVAGGSAS